MSIFSLFKKNIILQVRDYWALLITISLGPFFVFIYWLITAGFPSYYNVLVVNNDQGNYGQAFIDACCTDPRMAETMHLKPAPSVATGKEMLKKRDADALIELPTTFSQNIMRQQEAGDTVTPVVRFYGEKSNIRYLVGAITAYTAADAFIKDHTGTRDAWKMEETFIDEEKIKRSDFELQVPGILILSVIMLLFSAGMLMMRDIEDQSLLRLRLTPMTAFDYAGGVTLAQVLTGVVSVVLTWWAATLFGFHGLGSIFSVVVICLVAFIGIIGVTFMVVSFCKNATVFVIAGQFPLFVLVFFSGAMMPVPRHPLLHLWENAVCWNDLLPTGMSVVALNGVFNDGKSVADLSFPLFFSLVLSVLYFVVGIYFFNQKQLKV